MHANTVFLLGLGLLLVAGKGFGYTVPEDNAEGKRSDGDSEGLARNDDLNRADLRDEEAYRSDSADVRHAAAAAAAAAARSVRREAAATRAAAAAAAAATRSAAAAAAAAARRSARSRLRGAEMDMPDVRFATRAEDTMRDNDEIVRTIRYMDDENVRENDIVVRSNDYEEALRNDDELMRDDTSLEFYYRFLPDPVRSGEDELQTMDESLRQEPESISKRLAESLRDTSPDVYIRLLDNAARSAASRHAAAAAAAAAARSAAAAGAAAARSAAAAGAAASRSAAAGAGAASRSAAAGAGAASRSSRSFLPFSARKPLRFVTSRSNAARSAAASGAAATRSAAAAAAAAAARSAAAAAGAAARYYGLDTEYPGYEEGPYEWRLAPGTASRAA